MKKRKPIAVLVAGICAYAKTSAVHTADTDGVTSRHDSGPAVPGPSAPKLWAIRPQIAPPKQPLTAGSESSADSFAVFAAGFLTELSCLEEPLDPESSTGVRSRPTAPSSC